MRRGGLSMRRFAGAEAIDPASAQPSDRLTALSTERAPCHTQSTGRAPVRSPVSGKLRRDMSSSADERSRILGGLVCLSAIAAGALFIGGVLAQNYWALAIPVAAVTLFVLGLVTWIGWTIAT